MFFIRNVSACGYFYNTDLSNVRMREWAVSFQVMV